MKATSKSRMVLSAVVLAALLSASACGLGQLREARAKKAEREWQPPKVVTIEGEVAAYNYSRISLWVFSDWIIQESDDHPVALPVRDGDILALFEFEDFHQHIHLYRNSDGTQLSFELDSATVKLNGKTVSLMLPEENGAWEWLEKATDNDLAQLRLLIIEELDSTHIKVLQRVSELNPEIRLGLGDDGGFLFAIAPIRSGLWLFDESIEAMEDWLRQADLEYLFFGDEEEFETLAFPTELPRLHTLHIMGWQPERTGSFPAGLERLHTLTILEADSFDLSALENLTGLQELHVMGSDSVTNIGALSRLPQLKAVTLSRSELDSLEMAALQELPGLRWLGLPINISQEQFAAVVNSHPDLIGLELVCENIHDLSPLRGLRELEYLVLLSPEVDYEPLRSLTSLRYLVLPEAAFADTVVEELEAALPQAVIVQAMDLCLGSGWILSLVPAVALMWLLRRRGQHPRLR